MTKIEESNAKILLRDLIPGARIEIGAAIRAKDLARINRASGLIALRCELLHAIATTIKSREINFAGTFEGDRALELAQKIDLFLTRGF